MIKSALFLISTFLFTSIIQCYIVDTSKLSVSGISSGGFMAVQFHVAYSSEIMGVGVFAGGPYYCAQGQLSLAFTNCMYGIMLDVNKLISLTKDFEKKHYIDQLANLTKSQIYLYSGTRDSVVYPTVMKSLQTYYQAFANNIKTDFNTASEHCIPTDNYGNTCSYKGTPYINNCNHDGAGLALKYIYGDDLNPRGKSNPNNLITIDQTKFIPSGYTASSISVAKTGYVYVPSACSDKQIPCKIHVSFHGCLQTIADIGDKYYNHAGFNEWAETNNIIVIYPQAVKSSFWPTNPNGCWDWWGYASSDYAFITGPQMQMVRDMMHSLID